MSQTTIVVIALGVVFAIIVFALIVGAVMTWH